MGYKTPKAYALPTDYTTTSKSPKNDSKNADSRGVYGVFYQSVFTGSSIPKSSSMIQVGSRRVAVVVKPEHEIVSSMHLQTQIMIAKLAAKTKKPKTPPLNLDIFFFFCDFFF